MAALLSSNLGDIPEAYTPLYHRDDREDLVAAMPAFNELGLKPSDDPNLPVAPPYGNSGYEEDSEETEDDDLEEVPPPVTARAPSQPRG